MEFSSHHPGSEGRPGWAQWLFWASNRAATAFARDNRCFTFALPWARLSIRQALHHLCL